MTKQLTDSAPAPPDFHRFTRLLSTLVPGFSGSALYDHISNGLWLSAGCPDSFEAEIRNFIEDQKEDLISADAGELQPRLLSDDSLLFAHTLVNHLQEPVGTLILLIKPGNSRDADTLEKKMAAATKTMAEILAEKHNLNAELDAMADELTLRYEELNLVYDTADGTKKNNALEATLEEIVKNCSTAMDALHTAMILLDRKVCISHTSNRSALDNKDYIDKQLNRVYALTMHTHLPLVINEDNDPNWEKLQLDLPYKLLSFPIMNKSDETIGVIVSIREQSSEDFLNSDRNLLMVMANKASKVIQSNYDFLTGLLNLDAFTHLLKSIPFSRSPLVPNIHTILYIDIDHMKVINETMGHQAGDAVLKAVAKLIKVQIRDKDFAARIAGDIFAILLYDCPSERGLAIAKRIKNEISQIKMTWEGKNLRITSCLGLAVISNEAPDIDAALDNAEIACNTAKNEGTNRIRLFTLGDFEHASLKNDMWWIDMLQEAISKNDLKLYCQKIQPLKKENHVLYYEILVRASGDNEEIILPQDFIPAAERYKLMPSLDRWVISSVLKLLGENWENLAPRKSLWAINISGQSFRDETFLDFIINLLQNSPVPAGCLSFEITETVAIDDLVGAQLFITSLRNIGCHLALDDFGSGVSSFTYLKNLDVDTLKIDGSIVKDIVESNVARAMVKAIQDVAEALKVKSVGEYVENKDIAEHLTRLGVDYAQGFFYGKPQLLETEIKNNLILSKSG